MKKLTVRKLVRWAHQTAVDKGWWSGFPDEAGAIVGNVWDLDEDELGAKLCLIHSEVSEALECVRKEARETVLRAGDQKPEGLGVELADVVIRVADLCGRLGINLEAELIRKMEYNKTRERRHGGKAL